MPDTRRQTGRVASVSAGTRTNQSPRNSDRIWRGRFDGLELSLGTVPDQDISCAAGICRDSTNTHWMDFSSAVTDKENTNTWAEGSGNGGMDDGITVAADTSYTVHGLLNPVSGSRDMIISAIGDTTGATALLDTAVIAAGYTHIQLLGFAKTDSTSDFLAFTQDGDETWWDASVQDFSTNDTGASASLRTLGSIPTGVRVRAIVGIVVQHTASSFTLVGHGDISTLPTPSGSHADIVVGSTGENGSFFGQILTNTSAQITTRTSVAATNMDIETHGYIFRRGK